MNILQTFGIPNRDLFARTTSIKLFDKELTTLFNTLSGSVKNRLINQGVGIEIEVENAVPFQNKINWMIDNDNSLRNSGYEYKTVYGCRVSHVSDALSDLFGTMDEFRKSQGSQYFHFSERTSVHVHLDARNLEENEVLSVLAVYTIFERSLFEYAGAHRMDNVFTIPLRYNPMDYSRCQCLRDLWVGWAKYAACNVKTLADFGTIEFRHMEGNSDYKRVMGWVLLLGLIIDYCRRQPRATIMEKIKKLKVNSEYSAFAFDVFGAFTSLLNLDVCDFSAAVSDAKMLGTISAEAGTSLVSKKKIPRVEVAAGAFRAVGLGDIMRAYQNPYDGVALEAAPMELHPVEGDDVDDEEFRRRLDEEEEEIRREEERERF